MAKERPSWKRLNLSPWGERGFARAIAQCTGGKNNDYPTRDEHSEEDELDFIEGYNVAMALFHTQGVAVFEAYRNEMEEENNAE